MISRARTVQTVFLVWTVFVWGVVRLRNIVSDPLLDGGALLGALALSGLFWIPALALLVALWVSRETSVSKRLWVEYGLMGLCGLTIGVWIYKIIDIAIIDNHPIGFIVVHTMLGAISILLAYTVGRQAVGSAGRGFSQ